MSDATVRRWQRTIVAEAEAKLGRPLREHERRFIESIGGLLALESIQETVRTASPEDLARYLSSTR